MDSIRKLTIEEQLSEARERCEMYSKEIRKLDRYLYDQFPYRVSGTPVAAAIKILEEFRDGKVYPGSVEDNKRVYRENYKRVYGAEPGRKSKIEEG